MPDPMDELRQSLERFAEAFVASVAVQLQRELDALTRRYATTDRSVVRLDKVSMECPNTAAHDRHTWSFPKSGMVRQCPGVAGTFTMVEATTERCLKDDAHTPHVWEHTPPTEGAPVPAVTLVRHCPGLTEVQCPDNLAHHVHTWHGPGPGTLRVSCPGLEEDREVQWCGVAEGHQAHEGPHPEGTGALAFCKGFHEVPVKRCLEGRSHLTHNWEDPITGTQACPGRKIFDMNLVPAGPDRSA